MATKKISELTEVTSPTSTDVFPIVNDGETKKVQLTNVKTVLGVTQAETDIDGLDTRLTTAEGEIDTAQTDIDGLDTRLTTAEGEIDTAQTDIDNLQTGWNVAGETWTYSSVDDPTGVITISGDKTSKYSLGMRIKFTNATNVIYGIITAISYSSPNTTLKFLHEIDPTDSLALHLMVNSAITNNYYSSMKVPFGFPLNPDKWSIVYSNTSNIGPTALTANVWANPGSSIAIPIGLWKVNYRNVVYRSAGTEAQFRETLSTTTSSETNIASRSFAYTGVETFNVYSPDFILNLTSKTTYYLLIQSLYTTATVYYLGASSPTLIKAVCAYL